MATTSGLEVTATPTEIVAHFSLSDGEQYLLQADGIGDVYARYQTAGDPAPDPVDNDLHFTISGLRGEWWFMQNAVDAGLVIPKLVKDMPSNDSCLNLENKHPTHSLMLSNQDQTIPVTIAPGYKSFITEKACVENEWTVSAVAPPPPPEPEVDVG